MNKFKGYDVVDDYPEDGWLKGYFYARREDVNGLIDDSTKAYRDLSLIRHKDYILHLLNIKKDEKVFDIGCSDGAIMVYCGLLGAEVYGVDISSKSIEKANKYLTKYGIKGKAILGNAKKTDFAESYFDKVVSCDFFEHLSREDNISVFEEARRVLKQGGIFIIKTPNLRYLRFSKLFKQLKRIMRLKNPFDITIPHTTGVNHQHIGLTSRAEMVKIIKSAGFINFKFHYDINSKIERLNYFLGELVSEIPFLRDLFSEDLIVVIYKPIILSFFP